MAAEVAQVLVFWLRNLTGGEIARIPSGTLLGGGAAAEARPMPILPIIDLLILVAWTALAAGGVLKLVNLAFAQSFMLLGFAPLDLLIIAAVLLVFALVAALWTRR